MIVNVTDQAGTLLVPALRADPDGRRFGHNGYVSGLMARPEGTFG